MTKYTFHVVSIGAASSEHFKIAFLHHAFVEQLPLISRKRALETSPLDGREAGLFIFKSRHAEVQLNRASETVYVGFNESGWAKSGILLCPMQVRQLNHAEVWRQRHGLGFETLNGASRVIVKQSDHTIRHTGTGEPPEEIHQVAGTAGY